MQKVIKNKRNVIKGEINRASSDKSSASHSSLSLLGSLTVLSGRETQREREIQLQGSEKEQKENVIYICTPEFECLFQFRKGKGNTKKTKKAM